MNKYECFLTGKTPIDISAETSYRAQCQAAKVWKLKDSKRSSITVVLLELADGTKVRHSTAEL